MSMPPSSIQSVPLPVPTGSGGRPAPAAVAGVAGPVPGTPRSAASPQPSPEATPEQLKKAVDALQRRLSTVAPELQFSVDKSSGRSIILVTDPATNQVIQQIPSETVLRIAKEIDHFQGLLLNKKG